MRSHLQNIIAAALIIFLLYILMRQPFTRDTPLMDALLNAGHIPLFGLLALCMLILFRKLIPVDTDKAYIHYLLSFVFIIIIGAGSELLQALDPDRQADINDFIFDLVGGSSFLLLASLLDPHLKQRALQKYTLLRPLLIVLAISSWLPGILPVYFTLKIQQLRAYYYPALIMPGKFPTDFFIKYGNVTLSELPIPHPQKQALKWTPGIQTSWPFIRIDYPQKNWSAYKMLELDLYSPSSIPIRVTVRVDDQYFDHDKRHTLSKTFTVKNGFNHISLNLNQPMGHQHIDLKKIQYAWLALPEPAHPHTLYITYMGLK